MNAPAYELIGSEYIHWAKTASRARFNLATSGLANLKLNDLHAKLEDLEITSDFGYGYPPLLERIATRFEVDADSVVTAAGTSFANHLAMAAVLRPGDEVLIEQPTYEPLLSLARYFGAEVKRFSRPFADGFRVSQKEIEANISQRTRLIVITNMHNPTGTLTDEATLRTIGNIARSVGAYVLVDEVYLETLFDERPPTALHYGPEFIVTSSLTKAFGLSGLRCGWILAAPALARRMWLLNDIFSGSPVHAGERLSVVAFDQLGEIARGVKVRLDRNRELLNQFLDSRDDLESTRPEFGTIMFPRLKNATANEFCEVLREKYETSVVPGDFFESPQHFRVGLGGEADLEEGSRRIGLALDETKRT
jgi:aspartate/methionine/tyrosine aminotransferase